MSLFKVKSKDTVYNGYNFRSRLEARWASFFDEMGIEYVYEPQSFILESGTLYIPDFYLPKMNAFVEIKFEKLGPKDFLKAKNLVIEGDTKIFILDSDPGPTNFNSFAKDDNDPKGFYIGTFSLILNDNKDNFRHDLQLQNREQYLKGGFEKEIKAIDKARYQRFGVHE